MTKITRQTWAWLLLALGLFLTSGMAQAQVTVAPFLTSNPQFLDTNGNPLNGGCVFTYSAGTVTPAPTYSDSAGSVLNANPVILNSGGFPSSGGIWLTSAAYKFVVKSSGGTACASGSTITTTDNITWATPLSTFAGLSATGDFTLTQSTAATSGANHSSNNLKICGTYWTGAASAVDCWTIADVLGSGSNPSTTLTISHSGSSGSATVSWPSMTFNNLTVTGAVTAGSVSTTGNVSVGGNETVTGNTTLTGTLNVTGASTLSSLCFQTEESIAIVKVDTTCGITTWAAALALLPAAGGILDGTSPNAPTSLGTFDPGSRAVTMLFGPKTYTADHIVIEGNMQMIGTASDNISGAGTIINSVGLNTQPLIVNNTSGLINVRGVQISNIVFTALSGNTSQQGMSLDVSSNTTASVIDNLNLHQVNFSGFKGNSIHLKGSTNTGTNGSFIQFMNWQRVVVVRPASGGEALRVEGAVGQFSCYDCRFDGNAKGDGNNIYIGGTSNSDVSFPYSIGFYSTTVQSSDTGFTGNGYHNVEFYNMHCEQINGVYLLQSTFTNSKDNGSIFSGGYFANCGSNSGSGYILKSTTTQVYGALLEKNNFTTTHDKTVNSTNLSQITVKDNVFGASVSNPIITAAVDAQMAPAATLNLGNYHTVMLQASGTSVTTVNSALGPGEMITFFANGTCQFATGGNLDLGGNVSPFVLTAGEYAIFVNSDYSGANVWRLTGYSRGTNQLRTVDGSASAPSQSFISETNTGAYRASSNNIAFTVGGTAKWLYNSTIHLGGSGWIFGWSSNADPTAAGADTGLSRCSATPGALCVGTGAAGSSAGTIQVSNTLAMISVSCTGTATAGTTLAILTSGGACTATTGPIMPVGTAGTVKNLACHSLTGGVNGSSGVVTVRKNVVSQTLTCTFGTGTSCSDTTHSFSVAANDTVDIIFTTQAAETLANVACSVEKR